MKAVYFFNNLELYIQNIFKKKIVCIAVHFTLDRDIFHLTLHRLQLYPLYDHVGLSNNDSGKITKRLRSVKRKHSQRTNFDSNDAVFHDHQSLKTRKSHNNLCVEKRKEVTVSIDEELFGLSNPWCCSSFRSLLLGYITDSKAKISFPGLLPSFSFKWFVPPYQKRHFRHQNALLFPKTSSLTPIRHLWRFDDILVKFFFWDFTYGWRFRLS